ncbi:hypothetical protein LAZ67_5001136 [Cordylochernes scorpioides]|uniref:TIR domain-containing protein n=1 Tax=Cordylochernes scorpioides TaxID=51811 RepID=A0ABY6KK42_9ARAC|nr:hypothetical protein LAZ67_5001136 [Cordylochernes scorpioides]
MEGNKIKILPEDIFHKLTLMYINIGYNELETLPENIFKNQFQLRTIHMFNNKIYSLYENTFSDLHSLQCLDIGGNKLQTIAPKTFISLQNILILSMYNNKLITMNQQWFKNKSLLKTLDFSDNPITYFSMNPENLFIGVRNIRFLFIRNGNLTEIPESLLSTLPNLANLYMNSNQINNISINTFKMNKMLSRLDLSENNINFIPNEMFKSQNNLKYLLLSKNNITRVTKGMFKYLYRLILLTLNNNHIEFIEENSFDDVFLLDALLLENNKLEYLPRDIFKRNRIRSLILYGNRLTSFDNLYQNVPFLQVILNNNKFTYLKLPIMKIYAELVELNNNQIEFINITKTIFEDSSTNISLKDNPLNCDCKLLKFYHYFKSHKDTFKNNIDENLLCNSPSNMKGKIFSSLEENNFICNIEENCPEQCKCYIREMDRTTFMDCSDSKLVTLPTKAVHNVSILNMRNNRISSLANLSLPEWRNLREINFENNQLLSENWELPQFLEYVNLQNNNLSWLSSDIFKLSEFNRFKIELGNNPWNCICNISSMIYWLKSIREKVEDLEDVTCENSISEKENYIHPKLHEIEFKSICNENVDIRPLLHIYILGISSIAILIIMLIIVLYHKYKQTVLAYLYIHGYRIFLCFYNEEEMDEDKTYDAFICYSHEDRDVAVELSAELESKSPYYTLCIHERDWTPGNTISSNVFQSVRDSRRTVLILSDVFLRSPWFPIEFKTVYHQMMEDRMDRIILVIKGELPDSSTLDPNLQLLLQTKTYLEWNERWFWEKIRYALPHKK